MTTPHDGVELAANNEIAHRIKTALVNENVNVRSLSDKTGISYPTLRRSLSGGRSLTISELAKIAATIGIPPSALMPDSFARNATAA